MVQLIYGLLFVGLGLGLHRDQGDIELLRFTKDEQTAERIIGGINGLVLRDAKFFNDKLDITLDKELLKDSSVDVSQDIKMFGGKGVEIKSTKYPIGVNINPPTIDESICGLVIGSSHVVNRIKKVQILWKPKPQMPWDLLTMPSTGDYLFGFDTVMNEDNRVLLFDPVPISNLRLIIHANDDAGLNLTLALIYGCQYEGNVQLSCGEAIDGNSRFADIKEGVPISISCPPTCSETRSCTGYKVYSSEDSICQVSEQALGRRIQGNFFLYKISKVAIFRDQANPFLNAGIYCRRSTVPHSGISFTRLYYDFSVKEFQRQNGS